MSDLVQRLGAALTESRWDDYDEAWMDAIEADQGSLTEFLRAAREALSQGQGERAGLLLSLSAPQAAELDVAERCEFFEVLCSCLPKERDHRDSLAAAFQEQYGDVPGYEAYVRAADLKRTPEPARAAQLLRGMLRFKPGSFVFHRSGWGVGEITNVSHMEGVAVIDFEGKSGHRVKLDAIPEICDFLEKDSLKVRIWRDPQGLRALATENGVELIKLALADSDRPMQLKRIREALVGKVISSSEWSKWWTKQRAALKKDPTIGMGGGRDATYFLQEEAAGPVEELKRRLQGQALKDRLKLLRDAMQELDPGENPEVVPFLLELRKNLLRGDGDPGLRLEVLLFLRRLGGELATGLPEISSYLNEGEHAAEMVNSIHRAEDQVGLIEALEAENPEQWPQLMVELLLRCAGAARDYLVRRMVDAGRGEELDTWAREIQRLPRKEPMYFLWLVKLACNGDFQHVPSIGKLPSIHLFRHAVRVLDDLVVRSEHDHSRRLQVLIKRYRTQLGGRPFALMDAALLASGGEQVRELYGVVEGSQGFSGTTRQRMLALILRRFPKLLATDTPVARTIGDDVIYSTKEGIERIRHELEVIRNEKLPAIYEAIGDAADMGDLSENYEFTSAIEERENLNRRVLKLQAQLDKARPIDLASVNLERASLGARLKLTNLASGEKEAYVILGPWDSQAEAGIISYKAPLGRALLDHPVGAEVEVELPDGQRRYRIDGIEAYAG